MFQYIAFLLRYNSSFENKKSKLKLNLYLEVFSETNKGCIEVEVPPRVNSEPSRYNIIL